MSTAAVERRGAVTIPLLLVQNPRISDRALEGVVEANLPDFTGYVRVATVSHPFATQRKEARKIYITPYGCSVVNFLVSLKRLVVGVTFDPLLRDGQHITLYVLGLLQYGTAAYTRAKEEVDQAFIQGRRFTLIIANDATDLSVDLEQDRGCTLL